MSAAQQVYFTSFDAAFFRLPPHIRSRIESKIDDLGRRLETFEHHRLTGTNRYRMRVGDYRIIYTFDLEQGILYLLAIGHRREIYRNL